MAEGGLDQSVFIHERALCESVDIGPRTRVWAFAQVMEGARIGADCNICGHSFIESGVVVGDGVTIKNGVQIFDKVTLEDSVFVGPGAVFTNDLNPRAAVKKPPDAFLTTVVKKGATLGANVTVVCGVVIGEQAFVGAGAVVVRNAPAHALVVGNPARRAGWMCACGVRLPETLACDACDARYRLVDYAVGLVPMD